VRVYGQFDFGLTDEQEARASRLHESSIIFDLHWQGPCSPDVWTDELLGELREELPPAADEIEFTWSFFVNKALRGEFPLYRDLYLASGSTTGLVDCELVGESHVLRDAFRFNRRVNGFEWARSARTAADVRAAKANNEIAFWGVCAFNMLRPGDLHLIEMAHELGVLHVCELAYNKMNFIAAGCTERHDAGLSHFGFEFVRACNDVGVIIDSSHTGRQSTLDACEASCLPVVATHTSAASLYGCDRAKSDEELDAIAASGGVIGVYAMPFFLTSDPSPTINAMLDHIDYMVQRVGWQHVGIGTDWPLPLPLETQHRLIGPYFESLGFRPEHRMDVAMTLDGFRDPRDLRNITRGLVSRDYADDQVRAILGENFLRVFEAVCG
jgi:membrane dipeptidase